jgi:hypothetical protein
MSEGKTFPLSAPILRTLAQSWMASFLRFPVFTGTPPSLMKFFAIPEIGEFRTLSQVGVERCTNCEHRILSNIADLERSIQKNNLGRELA